jgi:hypothetical protein
MTHQLLLAVLGAAANGGRRAVATELLAAARHRGLYRDSHEELSPVRHDPTAILPVAAAVLATLLKPVLYSWFTEGSVTSYALTAEGWQAIVDRSHELGSDRAESARLAALTTAWSEASRMLESMPTPHQVDPSDPSAST